MKRHTAPKPERDETPENYLIRSINFLSEPDRRRVGTKHARAMREAVKRLRDG